MYQLEMSSHCDSVYVGLIATIPFDEIIETSAYDEIYRCPKCKTWQRDQRQKFCQFDGSEMQQEKQLLGKEWLPNINILPLLEKHNLHYIPFREWGFEEAPYEPWKVRLIGKSCEFDRFETAITAKQITKAIADAKEKYKAFFADLKSQNIKFDLEYGVWEDYQDY